MRAGAKDVTISHMERRFYQSWFEVWEAEAGVFVIQEPFHAENVKSYLVVGSERAVLIDTGMGVGNIAEVVRDLTALPVTVVNSHAHWDHVGGNWRFSEIAIHRSEATALENGRANTDIRRKFDASMLKGPLPSGETHDTLEIRASRATTVLDGGERFDLGGRVLDVVHAPGHSPGGIVLLDPANRIMFSTDVVYAGAVYAQFADSSVPDYVATLRELDSAAGSVQTLYPSHGKTPVEPGIIKRLRIAMESIQEGRPADGNEDGVSTHAFDGFSVLVRTRVVNEVNGP